MRVLITGGRDFLDRSAVNNALMPYIKLSRHEQVTFVHGHCPTGADHLADQTLSEMLCTVERHPANWDAHGKAAGPKRNQQMVDLGADVCIAFPRPNSRGTWDCVRRARAAGIRVKVVNERA